MWTHPHKDWILPSAPLLAKLYSFSLPEKLQPLSEQIYGHDNSQQLEIWSIYLMQENRPDFFPATLTKISQLYSENTLGVGISTTENWVEIPRQE